MKDNTLTIGGFSINPKFFMSLDGATLTSIRAHASIVFTITHKNKTSTHTFTAKWFEPTNKFYSSMNNKDQQEFTEKRDTLWLRDITRKAIKSLSDAIPDNSNVTIQWRCTELCPRSYYERKFLNTSLKKLTHYYRESPPEKRIRIKYETYFFEPKARVAVTALSGISPFALAAGAGLVGGGVACYLLTQFAYLNHSSLAALNIAFPTLVAIGATLLVITLALPIAQKCIRHHQKKDHSVTRPEISVFKESPATSTEVITHEP